MKLVFICAPYRGPTQEAVTENIAHARRHAINVINSLAEYDYFPVTPHLNTMLFDFNQTVDVAWKTNDEYWIKGTSTLMSKCDIVYCPYLIGELTSGMKQELAIANELVIPVYNKLSTIINAIKRDLQ